MEKVDWKVDGMTCSNCALTISKYLQKEGMQDVKVNPIDGRVSFENPDKEPEKLKSGIRNLGYTVLSATENGHSHGHDHEDLRTKFFGSNKKRFLFCLPFTLVLMMHMFDRWLAIEWLMNPWLQLGLCLPVFIVGMDYFGRSAINSLKNGVPNMNVLIALGALSAFVYSLTGAILGLGHDYLFFETAASIITLVFLGNYMEDVSIQSTQRVVRSLAKSQKVMANMIAFDDKHEEQIFPIENIHLKTGDLILIRNGEPVPIDCKILWGDCTVNEAIITG
ncbi:MAG: cation-translocating P-type ATPase, partial [Chitinophagaceae bacterium]